MIIFILAAPTVLKGCRYRARSWWTEYATAAHMHSLCVGDGEFVAIARLPADGGGVQRAAAACLSASTAGRDPCRMNHSSNLRRRRPAPAACDEMRFCALELTAAARHTLAHR